MHRRKLELWCKAALVLVAMCFFAGCAAKPLPQPMVESGPWIYIAGEIKNPGRISATNEGVTLLQAIHQAGGFTEQAYVQRIRVMQPGKTNLFFNYFLIQRGDEADPLLPAGSIIHVGYMPF